MLVREKFTSLIPLTLIFNQIGNEIAAQMIFEKKKKKVEV